MSPLEFIEEGGKGIKDFADKNDINYNSMWRTVTGRASYLRYDIAELFYRLSDGRVSLEDWVSLAEAGGHIKKRKKSHGNEDRARSKGPGKGRQAAPAVVTHRKRRKEG